MWTEIEIEILQEICNDFVEMKTISEIHFIREK